MYKTVCFTGHRNIEFTKRLKKDLVNTVENLIKNGATDFYAGCADGFDLLCEIVVLMFQAEYPQVRLHLVLPEGHEERVKNWGFFSRQAYGWVEILAETEETYPDYKTRNQKLADHGDICVCYYNKSNVRSGTGQTVRMAEKRGIEVINLYK